MQILSHSYNTLINLRSDIWDEQRSDASTGTTTSHHGGFPCLRCSAWSCLLIWDLCQREQPHGNDFHSHNESLRTMGHWAGGFFWQPTSTPISLTISSPPHDYRMRSHVESTHIAYCTLTTRASTVGRYHCRLGYVWRVAYIKEQLHNNTVSPPWQIKEAAL